MYNYPAWSRQSRTAGSRSRAAVRRRQVMSALLVCLGVPLLVAVATGSGAAWWAVLAILPLVTAYTAFLYRVRRLTAEKEMNAAFLGSASRSEATLAELFGPLTDDPLLDDVDYLRDEEPVSAAGGDW